MKNGPSKHQTKILLYTPIVICGFRTSSFNERVDRLAKGLLFIGIKPGDKVGVWAKNVPPIGQH